MALRAIIDFKTRLKHFNKSTERTKINDRGLRVITVVKAIELRAKVHPLKTTEKRALVFLLTLSLESHLQNPPQLKV